MHALEILSDAHLVDLHNCQVDSIVNVVLQLIDIVILIQLRLLEISSVFVDPQFIQRLSRVVHASCKTLIIRICCLVPLLF